MFDIGWTELLVLAVVAILIVGPKDLPRMLYSLGQALGKVRRQADEFRRQFNDSMREAGMDEMRNDMKKMSELNPAHQIKDEIESTFRDNPKPAGSTASQSEAPAHAPSAEADGIAGSGKPETAKTPGSKTAEERTAAAQDTSHSGRSPVRSGTNGAADTGHSATAKDAVS